MRFWKSETFLKSLPSLIRGAGPKRLGSIWSWPCFREYRSDLTSIKSEQVLTGKKRLRGTFTPWALWKWRIAAPTAVSSWTIETSDSPFLSAAIDLLLGIISISSSLFSTIRLTAFRFNQMLLVLKYLNFLMDLNSLVCSFGTWAISRSRTDPS